jgi:hypothetical protein
MIGTCVCGSVCWTLDNLPSSATICNCTACRKYAALWAYAFIDEGVTTKGITKAYARGTALEFHFCANCGTLAFYRGLRTEEDGKIKIALNLRLANPDAVAKITLERFDGLDTFDDLPLDGRCVSDVWF